MAGLNDSWWKENLRMSKETFKTLCDLLRPHIERQTTQFREPISVEARVAVTVWKLATNVEYRTIAELFGLGRSTVGEIVLDTCDAVTKFLLPQYVHIPQDAVLQEMAILKPVESGSDYYNRKGYYSILMQALGIFMNINVGWPGKVHDARVFANSSLFKKANNGTLLPSRPKLMNGVQVPLVILGDPAYPLMPWLMKPYLENSSTTTKERHFNYRQSRARMVVENAFGRLKGRWRCLLKRIDANVYNVPNIVATCVVLHNICELHGDSCEDEWMVEVDTTRSTGNSAATPTSTTTIASSIRDAIRDSL